MKRFSLGISALIFICLTVIFMMVTSNFPRSLVLALVFAGFYWMYQEVGDIEDSQRRYRTEDHYMDLERTKYGMLRDEQKAYHKHGRLFPRKRSKYAEIVDEENF